MSKKKFSGDLRNIQEVLKDFVQENRLEKGLNEVNLQELWNALLGPGVQNYTTAVKLTGETLYVQLSNSVLREELSYGKSKIIQLLNEEMGKEVIKKLVLR